MAKRGRSQVQYGGAFAAPMEGSTAWSLSPVLPATTASIACPSCGHPGAHERHGAVSVLGRVAGTYISANALAGLVLGSVMFLSVVAVLITLILSGR